MPCVLGQEPGSEREKRRQGDGTSNDPGVFIIVLGGSTTTTPVSADSAVRVVVAVIVGCGISTIAGVTRDPTVVAQRLVPQEIWPGGVGLINAGEEGRVLSVRVTVDGTDSCNVRVESASGLFTRVRVDRKVEGLLNRPARVGSVLVEVSADIFSETNVCLSRRGGRNSCECSGIDKFRERDLRSWRPSCTCGNEMAVFSRLRGVAHHRR